MTKQIEAKIPEEILKEALKEHDRLSAEIIEVLNKNTPGTIGEKE